LASDEDIAAVEAQARAAQEAGINGVPCFIFSSAFAVSGAQSPEYLAEAIGRAAATQRTRPSAAE
jgi:predicted DsbA family dithiol-disulfide isomerase